MYLNVSQAFSNRKKQLRKNKSTSHLLLALWNKYSGEYYWKIIKISFEHNIGKRIPFFWLPAGTQLEIVSRLQMLKPSTSRYESHGLYYIMLCAGEKSCLEQILSRITEQFERTQKWFKVHQDGFVLFFCFFVFYFNFCFLFFFTTFGINPSNPCLDLQPPM